MLPKKFRFSSRSFPRTKPTVRRTFSWGSASLYTATSFQAAVVISKKTLKSAVDRNRARRRVYAALAKAAPETGAIVVFPNASVLKESFEHMVRDLAGLSK